MLHKQLLLPLQGPAPHGKSTPVTLVPEVSLDFAAQNLRDSGFAPAPLPL